MPNQWDRESGEPATVYAAFLVYRDLGYQRTVLEAYRQATGRLKADQASGMFQKHYKDFRWRERAAAWDAHCETEKQKADLKAMAEVRTEVRLEVARELIQTTREEVAYARKCLARGDVILGFPLAEKRVTKTVVDPVSKQVYELETHWEGMDARMVALATKIGETGFALIYEALDRVEALERGEVVKPELNDQQLRRVMDRTERYYQEWNREKERKPGGGEQPQLMPPTGELDEAAS